MKAGSDVEALAHFGVELRLRNSGTGSSMAEAALTHIKQRPPEHRARSVISYPARFLMVCIASISSFDTIIASTEIYP